MLTVLQKKQGLSQLWPGSNQVCEQRQPNSSQETELWSSFHAREPQTLAGTGLCPRTGACVQALREVVHGGVSSACPNQSAQWWHTVTSLIPQRDDYISRDGYKMLLQSFSHSESNLQLIFFLNEVWGPGLGWWGAEKCLLFSLPVTCFLAFISPVPLPASAWGASGWPVGMVKGEA